MSRLRQLNLSTTFGSLRVAGGSRAGEATLVVLPQLRLALDAGRQHRALTPLSTLIISHGHADHIGGLAYWASQRFLGNLGSARLLAPRAAIAGIRQILDLHATLEGGRPYAVECVGLEHDDRVELRKDMDLRFFRTDHWVPTLGTEILYKKWKLRRELIGLSGPEIADLRRAGQSVSECTNISLLSYCADCGPGIFASRPQVLSSEVLILECSFFHPIDRDRARRYGHLHLDDIRAIAPRLECRHLILTHASRRHGLREVESFLESDLRPLLACSLDHLNVDWD